MVKRYTHGHHESVLRSHRWRTAANSAAYLLPHLTPGLRLLDVGSGPGTITAELAELVTPGETTALEISQAAADLTRVELARRGVSGVEVVVGDVHDLAFPDDAFDVVHAHQVLQHVADPVQALREMARVTRPGGLIAVRDSDYAAKTWYPASPALDRWLALYDTAARRNGGEPNAGRHLLAWAHAAGLDDARVTTSTWCFATPEDREYWGGMWADRILHSALTEQLLREALSTAEELQEISRAWSDWAADPDGYINLVHGELLVRVA
jgi:SAM-dependent methyltransferase